MHTRAVLVLAILTTLGCGVDRHVPPPRSSPLLTAVDVSASVGLLDRAQPGLVWWDDVTDRISRLRDGHVEVVQDRALRAELGHVPDVLRVFDDGSAIALDDHIHLLPADGTAAVTLELEGHEAVDGTSIEDFWIGGTWLIRPRPGLTGDYGACHVVARTLTDCVAFPAVGGYEAALVVTSDGAVLMSDRRNTIHRWDGASIQPFAVVESDVTGMRGDGVRLIVSTFRSGVYVVGDTIHHYGDGSVRGPGGTADDLYFVTVDSESEPSSSHCGFPTSTCTYRTLWSETVVEHVVDGRVEELGHETCAAEGMEPACALTTGWVGVDGDHAVVVGNRFRRTI